MKMSSSKLIEVVCDNLDFYKIDKNGERFREISQSLLDILNEVITIVKDIECFASVYDFDESTPGDGYRSYVYLFESAVKRTLQICEHVKYSRESVFFRQIHNEK